MRNVRPCKYSRPWYNNINYSINRKIINIIAENTLVQQLSHGLAKASEAHSEPSQTSKIVFFAKKVNSLKLNESLVLHWSEETRLKTSLKISQDLLKKTSVPNPVRNLWNIKSDSSKSTGYMKGSSNSISFKSSAIFLSMMRRPETILNIGKKDSIS